MADERWPTEQRAGHKGLVIFGGNCRESLDYLQRRRGRWSICAEKKDIQDDDLEETSNWLYFRHDRQSDWDLLYEAQLSSAGFVLYPI